MHRNRQTRRPWLKVPLRKQVFYAPICTCTLQFTAQNSQQNLDDESRNDHRSALIVQDVLAPLFSPEKSRDALETASCLRRFFPSFQKPERVFFKQFQRISQKRVRICNGRTTRILFRNLRSKWTTPSMVGLCAMECSCHLRNVHDKMTDGKTAHKEIFDVKFDGPLIPFGATVSPEPISAKDEARLHQLGKTVLPGNFVT